MARGRYSNISGSYILGKKSKQEVVIPRTRKAATRKFRQELERWVRIQAAMPKLTPEEIFLHREGMHRLTFDRLVESYMKHATLKPQNVLRAPDVLAQDLAAEANVPYIKAHAFVGWARWGLRERQRMLTEAALNAKKKP